MFSHVFSGDWDAHTLDMLRFLLTDLMTDSQWGLMGIGWGVATWASESNDPKMFRNMEHVRKNNR